MCEGKMENVLLQLEHINKPSFEIFTEPVSDF